LKATFITLAAYDWHLLPTSIAAYYDHADEILIGLDQERLSWSGLPFHLDRAALEQAIPDLAGKIRIVEGAFYSPSRTPMENDCAERQALSAEAANEWTVEVDADEIVTDVPALFDAMAETPPGRQVFGLWRDVFKVQGETALVVDTNLLLCALATRSRRRVLARQSGERAEFTPVIVEHLTLGRSRAEVAQKLASWSHSDQVKAGFLERWDAIDLDNFEEVRNVHPFKSERWPRLHAVPVAELAWGAHLLGVPTRRAA
jgi:hypothetical protein